MNPVILYDNRFADGVLSATDTESGYDVNNIKDLRAHTFWKAASPGTKCITEVPLLKDTLAQEEMRISPADGYAGVYLPASLDLTPYLGDRIVCLDSALKKHIGYIKSIGDKAVNLTSVGSSTNGINISNKVRSSGSVTLANMRLSLADGCAFVDFSAAGVLTDYIGKRIVITDSAGKKISGYIRAAGTGETYGSEELSNREDWTGGPPPDGWIPTNCTIAATPDAGPGGAGDTCLTITRTDSYMQRAYQIITCVAGALYKATVYVKSGTSGNEYYRVHDEYDNNNIILGTSSGSWVQAAGYYTEPQATTWFSLRKFSATPGTMLFDKPTYQRVLTPAATGVTIVSTPDGSTYNWESIDSGFNYNDLAGYTYQITDYNIEMGINDCTFVWEGALPAWTPTGGNYLLFKNRLLATGIYDGWLLGVQSTGKIRLALWRHDSGQDNQSTVAANLTDGTKHTIMAILKRETATSDGYIKYFVDKVKLGDTITLPAAATKTISNTLYYLYILGATTFHYPGTCHAAAIYNRAFSDAEAEAYTGVPAADQYGSQENKCTNGELTIDTSGWSGAGNTRARVDSAADPGTNSVTDGAADQYVICGTSTGAGANALVPPYSLSDVAVGQRLEIEFLYYVPSGGGNLNVQIQDGTWRNVTTIEGNLTTKDAWTRYKGYWIVQGPITGAQIYNSAAGAGEKIYIDAVRFIKCGALLDLNESGIGDTEWEDSSANNNDAAYPSSGCAVVRYNNIVSTPGGSTYNWESKETGFNHADAGGYAYKISEPDACDALFLIGHNLGTAEASVSVESSDDEVNWTERLAVFTPTDDRALMKLLTSFRAASKRLKIDTASIAPYIAVAMLGVRMEFPFPPDSPYDPYNIGIESESEVSVEGNHLGDVVYYHPIAQRAIFSNPLRSFITDTYKPFWDAHGKLRRPFAWAWDLTDYPDIVYFMKLTKSARLSMPLSVGTYADALVLDMEGVAEP